ncbi:MAG: extracellular solute-binding protein, partial [Lachnospiraceae bacterium]|nr:extracellular solute-binding protein [Lachnospiraceae bacterium]
MVGTKKYVFLAALFLLALATAGCGKEKALSETAPISESIDYEAAYKAAPINDVLGGTWVKDDNGSADSFMTLSDYKAGVFGVSNPGKQFIWGYFADSKYLYSLEGFYSEDENLTHSVYLSKLNIETKTTEVIDYWEASDLWLQNPYSIGGRVFANAESYKDNEDETLVFQNVELLADGTILEMADCAPILEKEGIMPEVGVSPESKLIYEPASGRTYIIPLESDRIVIADESGDYVSTFRGFMGGGAQTLTDFAHTEDGHIIFMCAEGNKETVFVFENDEPRILYEGSRGLEADSSCGVIDSHGNILFVQGLGSGTVISWDIATGALQKLYSYGEDNARANTIDCLARNEKGELLLIINDNLKVLSLSGPASTVEITVAQLESVTYVPNQCIKRYEGTHPGVSIDTTAGVSGENREIRLNQLYTDIIKGTGPDLLFLSYDDLAPFVDNKCLYDLSDVLKPEIRDNLVPAVAASGCIE